MRQHVTSGSPFDDRTGFSRAVRVGDRVLVSGTAPVWPDRSCPDDVEAQTRRCLDIIATALQECRASVDDVVRTRMFLRRAADADAVSAAHGAVFRNVRPAATMAVVSVLLDPRWRVELEAEATASA